MQNVMIDNEHTRREGRYGTRATHNGIVQSVAQWPDVDEDLCESLSTYFAHDDVIPMDGCLVLDATWSVGGPNLPYSWLSVLSLPSWNRCVLSPRRFVPRFGILVGRPTGTARCERPQLLWAVLA